MTEITPLTTPLEDCRVLSSSIKDKYSFNATKRLIELKFKYRFKSVEEKEVIREFYYRFCCNRKEGVC